MGPAIKVFALAGRAVELLARRPKDALIALLVLLALAQTWRLRRTENRAVELAAKVEGLPPDTKQVVTVYRDRVLTKWRDGPTRVEYRDRYLPPEGRVHLVTKAEESSRAPALVIKDRGFTSRLGGGVIYAGETLPLLDIKWAYWRRYSLTVGFTPRFGGLGISRHIDDVTPFGNLEVLGMGGAGWSGESRFGIGLRTNF